jgi:hypothetical protein
MLEMLRDLIAHKGHANAALLTAIRQNPTAASDRELWELLHHILLANRFWLLTVLGLPFVHEEEAKPSSSFDALIQRFGSTQAQEATWLETATEGALARMLEGALIPRMASVPSRKPWSRSVCTRMGIALSVRRCYGDTARRHHRRTSFCG